ncbi:hypothetical protein DYU11_15555 [Fibrisoma montanum]|uniref:Uncharacterized protein n=1 Tax=Fibrisoma montanum TaxID=2305895 RepID=A0A418M8L2_9BACT|nr:hypothetical protein [Fibrisoma montanum]RIV22430.1 hypothetical protein DYU11_15555 [Fibrisoma montanum]
MITTRSVLRITLLCFLVSMNACIPDLFVSEPEWVVVEAGDHEPLPKRKTGVLIEPTELSATVTFDSTCIYDVGSVDEQDWNKVIGLGFVGSKDQDLGAAPHQIDGVRVGWRWNPQRQRIDLGAYAYVEGKRTDFKIAEAKINEPTRLVIKVDYSRKLYQVLGGTPIPFTHDKKFAYKTGLYFGGSQPAPHRIRVKIVY